MQHKVESPQLYAREPGVGLVRCHVHPFTPSNAEAHGSPPPRLPRYGHGDISSRLLLLLYILPAINSQTIISPCLIAGPVSWLAQNGIRACGILQITSRESCHGNRNKLCGKALPSAASSVFPSSSSCFTEGWHGEHPWGNALPLRQCASVWGRLRLHVQGRILPWRCHAEDQATNWEACRAQAQWSITRPDG